MRHQKLDEPLTSLQMTMQADKAALIIEAVDETEFNVRYFAQTIAEYFMIGLEDYPELVHGERVARAIELAEIELGENNHTMLSWQRHCGKMLAKKAFNLAEKIVRKRTGVARAIAEINGIISSRNRAVSTRKPYTQRVHSPLDTSPMDRRQASKPSPKQPYRRPTKAQRRKAA